MKTTKQAQAEGNKGMVAVLEPKGTYTEEAAHRLFPGEACEYFATFSEILEAVANNRIAKGVVPIENSIEGSVGEVLYALLEKDVHICGEDVLGIRHCLLAPRGTKEIRAIISHPQAIAQCKNFIKKKYPKAELKFSSSTAQAAKTVSEEKLKNTAAIASRINSEYYALDVLAEDIQDSRHNETRFIAVCKNPMPSGKKASLIIALKNTPGALYELLGEFSHRNINLVKIESKPSQKKLGEYVFFIDFEARGDSSELIGALRERALWLKYLGSY